MLDQLLSLEVLNRDLARITEWARQWRMFFNPDPSKQAVEVYFSCRLTPANAPEISFNNTNIPTSEHQKHLGLILDSKLSFDRHLDEKIGKANKRIGQAPDYLSSYLPARLTMPFDIRTRNPIYPLNIRTERFRNTFFPYCISQWNNLDADISNLPSVSTFKNAIFEFLRPKQNHVFDVFDEQTFN